MKNRKRKDGPVIEVIYYIAGIIGIAYGVYWLIAG